jgi:hypothetical protein
MEVVTIPNLIKMEQPLKTWGILNDEFPELELVVPCRPNMHTYACKAKGVDADAMEAKAAVNQQALESWTPGNHVVQRTLGDSDAFKRELLKLGEPKPLNGAVMEVAVCNGGNTKGGGEAGDV